jgi:hypothetical protein
MCWFCRDPLRRRGDRGHAQARPAALTVQRYAERDVLEGQGVTAIFPKWQLVATPLCGKGYGKRSAVQLRQGNRIKCRLWNDRRRGHW